MTTDIKPLLMCFMCVEGVVLCVEICACYPVRHCQTNPIAPFHHTPLLELLFWFLSHHLDSDCCSGGHSVRLHTASLPSNATTHWPLVSAASNESNPRLGVCILVLAVLVVEGFVRMTPVTRTTRHNPPHGLFSSTTNFADTDCTVSM